MFHIVGRPQESIRCRTGQIIFELPHKQQNLRAQFPMVDITLPFGRVWSCCTLALPMEQHLVDGVVLVHRGGRIVLIRLVQRDEEHIQLLVRQPFDTLTHGGRLFEIQRNQQLIARVGTMHIQRAVKAQFHRLVQEVDSVKPQPQQLQQFRQQDGTVRQAI